jgi:hypothetical protein
VLRHFVPIAVVLCSLSSGCSGPPTTQERTIQQADGKRCLERPPSYDAAAESRLKLTLPLTGVSEAEADATLQGYVSQKAGGTTRGEDLQNELNHLCLMANNGRWNEATTARLFEMLILDSKSRESNVKPEQEQQAQKPQLELMFDGLPQQALRDRFPLPLVLQPSRTATLNFAVFNEGKGSVLNPIISVSVIPQTVRVDGPTGSAHMNKRNHHRYEITGKTLHPKEISGGGYEFTIEVYVPTDIETFDLLFRIHGDNLLHNDLELTFRPSHYTKPG